MSNPFDDLDTGDGTDVSSETEANASSETEADEGATTTDSTPDLDVGVESDPEPTLETDTTREPVSEQEPDRTESADPGDVGPAFEYSDVRQRPLYARGETWDELEDEIGITVVPRLRRMGIRDEETREIHDALLKVALEHVDEVPERIRDARLED